MDNQPFLNHLQSISELATDANEVGQLDDFLDACQIFLQSKRNEATKFGLTPQSFN